MQALNQGKSVDPSWPQQIGYFFRLGFGVALRLAFGSGRAALVTGVRDLNGIGLTKRFYLTVIFPHAGSWG